MTIPKFNPKELDVVATIPTSVFMPLSTDIYNFPITPREACRLLYEKKPVWQITGIEQQVFCPKVNPDNVARAFVFDNSGMLPMSGGGKDMFGIDWEFVKQAGGSMVRPGKPFVEDADELAHKVVWPNIDSWEWESAAKYNESYLSDTQFNVCWFMNGWYERLISFMDFENAAIAIFDEEQQGAVHTFFEKLSELYIRIIDKYLEYFPKIDAFCIHDDWGSQKETFFSPIVAEKMIVPYMRTVTDFIHSKGRYCELHSCGMGLKQVQNFIKAGWDSWSPQLMNDSHKIYEMYGDKILVAVTPELFNPASLSEEDQRAKARAYANLCCDPKKPSTFNSYGNQVMSKAFREELYIQSRKNYCGE